MHKMISVRMAHPTARPGSCVGWMTLFSSTINARRWTGEASPSLHTEGAR